MFVGKKNAVGNAMEISRFETYILHSSTLKLNNLIVVARIFMQYYSLETELKCLLNRHIVPCIKFIFSNTKNGVFFVDFILFWIVSVSSSILMAAKLMQYFQIFTNSKKKLSKKKAWIICYYVRRYVFIMFDSKREKMASVRNANVKLPSKSSLIINVLLHFTCLADFIFFFCLLFFQTSSAILHYPFILICAPCLTHHIQRVECAPVSNFYVRTTGVRCLFVDYYFSFNFAKHVQFDRQKRNTWFFEIYN